jgi:signal transduction histidine kinase
LAVPEVAIAIGPTVDVMSRLPRPKIAHFRTRVRERGELGDLLLAAVLAIVGFSTILDSSRSDSQLAIAFAVTSGLVAPLVWRRRWPMQVFAVIAAVAFIQWLTGGRYVADVALLVAFYTVAAYENTRRTIVAAVVLEVGVVLASTRWAIEHSRALYFVLLSSLLIGAFLVGAMLRTRRVYLASVEDRAARLELERDQQAQIAAAAERARIAREMHDIVAHNLSVMIALADGAALTTPADPDRAAAAMNQVSATGREALTEMRRLLDVLREDQFTALEPQPGLVDLDQLLTKVRLVGLRGELITEGQLRALPAGLQLTVYRLVQEALTNTLKHAVDARTATVRLRITEDSLEVEVVDDGACSPSGAPDIAGHGIDGMRERAAIYGGTVEVGPVDAGVGSGRGWQVLGRFDLDTIVGATP